MNPANFFFNGTRPLLGSAVSVRCWARSRCSADAGGAKDLRSGREASGFLMWSPLNGGTFDGTR
jgi:hypothetical protein